MTQKISAYERVLWAALVIKTEDKKEGEVYSTWNAVWPNKGGEILKDFIGLLHTELPSCFHKYKRTSVGDISEEGRPKSVGKNAIAMLPSDRHSHTTHIFAVSTSHEKSLLFVT